MKKRFNDWYDSLDEPWRCILCVILAFPLILINPYILNRFLPELSAAAFVWCIFLLWLRWR